MQKIWLILMLLTLCPRFLFANPNFEACPSKGNLIPEYHHAETVSLSDRTGGYAFLKDMMIGLIWAQPNQSLLFILNASPQNIQKLQSEILLNHGNQFGPNPRKILSQIIPLQATGLDEMGDLEKIYLAWQQDYYKPQFDKRSGRPIASMVENYPDIGELQQSLATILKSHGIESLFSQTGLPAKNGTSGGNLDMLPDGVCLVGSADFSDKEWNHYSLAKCGTDSRRIKVSTSWLASFHLDELLRIVPRYDQTGCAFTLMVASPQKAIELLKADPNQTAFASIDKGNPDSLYYHATRIPAISDVCGTHQALQAPGNDLKPLIQKAIFSNDQIMYNWRAKATMINTPGPMGCQSMKNKDVAAAFELNPLLKEYSALVIRELDRIKSDVLGALKQESPGCRFDILEVPNLFSGPIAIKPNGTHTFPEPREQSQGYSVYPNPTNSVLMGNKILMPMLYNRTFEKYMQRSLLNRGIETKFIDTFLAHESVGNLHCLTQVLRSCTPTLSNF